LDAKAMTAPTKHDHDVNEFDLQLFALMNRAIINSQRLSSTPLERRAWEMVSQHLKEARVRIMMHPEHVKVTT
jgi:hypothetical protein